MPKEREAQVGVVSGLFAALMIVALSVMAFSALQPPRAPALHTAQLEASMPHLPQPQTFIPDAG